MIGRADVVVTTRLHGLVLALKQGVPALAVDPVAGGAKVAAQAAVWGWPVLLARSGNPVLDRDELDRLWSGAGPWKAGPGPLRARRVAIRDRSTADLLSALTDADHDRRP